MRIRITASLAYVYAGFSFVFNVFNGFARPFPEMPEGWKWLNRSGLGNPAWLSVSATKDAWSAGLTVLLC